MAYQYPFFVIVSIEFVGGVLEGLSTEQQCGYATMAGAESHVEAMYPGRVIEKPCGGGSPYRVVGSRIVEAGYQRAS